MKLSSAIYPLNIIAQAFHRAGLGESVLIGNMGAAVHGARVATDDFDYLVPPFRDLPKRIQAAATALGAVIYPPNRPYGTTVLIVHEIGLQICLLVRMSGITSFRALRTRAKVWPAIGNTPVASLRDIVHSKRAAGRPKDLAVLPELEATLHEIGRKKETAPTRRKRVRRVVRR
jgi:hypothetical protein